MRLKAESTSLPLQAEDIAQIAAVRGNWNRTRVELPRTDRW